MKNSISVIVPAYNEEKNLANTISVINRAFKNLIPDYEILIFNDCSKDRTKEIADEIAKKDNRVKVIHNLVNKGLGWNYIKGIELANKNYIMLIPGDDDIPDKSIKDIIKYIGKADIINPYFTNAFQTRQFHRVLISKSYVKLMNLILGLDLKYYTGIVLHKNSLLKSLKINDQSFSYQVEILAKLLKSGHSFIEIGIEQTGKGSGSSKFFTYKNISGILKSVFCLAYVIRLKERNKYNKKLVRVNY